MRKNINIETRNIDSLLKDTDNIYKTCVVVYKRAKQINSNLQNQITQKLEDFGLIQDDIKEVFENQEQIKISKYYERMQKPSKTAIEEFINGELVFKNKEEEKDNIEEDK